ncbi:MAG: energy-coupling factor transporter transmembrane component T [Candidatus Cloacimonadales bacterium]
MPKTNDLLYLILAMLYLLPVLLADSALLCLLSLALALVNLLIWRRINLKHLLLMSGFLAIPLASVFITVLLYTKGASQTPQIATWLGFPIYQQAWETAIFLTVRAGSLTLISFTFLLAIRSDALVFSLMQNLKLPVNIGYALLATFNAFIYMKDEFLRIRLAYRMRFQKQIFPLKLLIPILVSASRYAHYAGLSLESKGLHNKKTYCEQQQWQGIDWLVLLINLLQIICLIVVYKKYLGLGLALV